MKYLRISAAALLALLVLAALFAPLIAPHAYDAMFRVAADAPRSAEFPMGTDALGHDRFSRLLYGTRTSLLLAPAAAAVSVVIALVLAPLRPKAFVSGLVSLSLSLPWLFLFIIIRAELPLNTSPVLSIVLTFALMGVAGWAVPARVFAATFENAVSSAWMLQARAAGLRSRQITVAYIWPQIRSVAMAQFRVLIPAYILSEASLGLLGLGVPEPVPSWGNLLRELQDSELVRSNPFVLIPLALLMLTMICLEILAPESERL